MALEDGIFTVVNDQGYASSLERAIRCKCPPKRRLKGPLEPERLRCSRQLYRWVYTWGLLGSPGISWGLLGPPGASWGLLGPPGTSWGLLGFPGASWGFLGPAGAGFPGASWGFPGPPGTSWRFLGSSGASGALGVLGPPWGLLGPPGASGAYGVTWGFLGIALQRAQALTLPGPRLTNTILHGALLMARQAVFGRRKAETARTPNSFKHSKQFSDVCLVGPSNMFAACTLLSATRSPLGGLSGASWGPLGSFWVPWGLFVD